MGTVPRVPCVHASRIVYPHKSMVHHTLPSLSSMCDIFDLFQRLSFCARGARKTCRGDVSPADACDKIRKLESLTACFLHMWILEDWQDGKKEPHMAFPDKARKMLSCGEGIIGSTILSGCGGCALADACFGHCYYRREVTAIRFIQVTACAARVIVARRDECSRGKVVSIAICTIRKGPMADAQLVAKSIH